MQIKKLDTWQEWLAVDQIISTAFLFKFNAQEAEEKRKAEAEGTREREEEAWGLIDDNGVIGSGIITTKHTRSFDGQAIPCSEVHLVGSLPEARFGGNIRALMGSVLRDMKARGDLFATLFPFSYRFYRKFGFELMSIEMEQRLPVVECADFVCDYRFKRVSSAEDVAALRTLYEATAMNSNFRTLKTEKDWEHRDGDDFGRPDPWSRDRQKYTYLFFDEAGTAHAYLRFTFENDPQEFMVGTMQVSELVYDSPEALRNVLGFFYTMRAKIKNVTLTLPGGPDLSLLAPESNKVTRKLESRSMVRALDPVQILQKMRQPEGEGSYTLRIEDGFLPENTATYRVCWRDGAAVAVELTDAPADAEMTTETFAQAAIGLIDLRDAAYRAGTKVHANRAALERVFVRKP